MVAVRNPLIGMQVDEEAGAYIGVLERRVMALQINEFKFLALLEMITGEKWETMIIDFEQGNLDVIAREAIKRKLGCSDADARRIVREYNESMQAKQNTKAQQDAIDNNKHLYA